MRPAVRLLICIAASSGALPAQAAEGAAALVVVEQPAGAAQPEAAARALQHVIGILDRSRPGLVHPAAPRHRKTRSLSELEALLASGEQHAMRFEWDAAIAELIEVAGALQADQAPPAGRERLFPVYVRLARTWLEAARARDHEAPAPTGGTAITKDIARSRATEQFQAALRIFPDLELSTMDHPPWVVSLFAEVKQSMHAAAEPAELKVEHAGGPAELVVDGFLRPASPSVRLWPGRHALCVVDRSLAGEIPRGQPLPESILGPQWELNLPQAGLELVLPAAHARGVLAAPAGPEQDAQLRALGAALSASEVLVVSVAETAADDAALAQPRLVILDADRAALTESVLAELFPQPETEPEAEPEAEPEPAAALAAAEPVPEEDGRTNVWAWVATGIAGSTLAAGAIIGGFALSDLDELEGMAINEAGYQGQKDRTDNEALAADILIGVGAAAAVGALVLFLVDLPAEEPEPTAVLPFATSGGAGVAAKVRW